MAPWPALLSVLAMALASGAWCQSAFTFLPSAPGSGAGFSCSAYCASPSCAAAAAAPGCQIADGALRLAPSVVGPGPADWAARYMREEAVELWDARSGAPASFRTFFLVRVSRIDGYVPGDGMAFLIAPNRTVPARSDGAGLGVFAGEPGPAARAEAPGVVAVAFDLLPSFADDPADAPFVALLVNSSRPANYTQLDTSTLQALFVGNTFGVWAEYDAPSLSMQVSMILWPATTMADLSNSSEVGRGLRSSARSMFTVRGLNLTERVAQASFLGFSAGTKGAAEVQEVFFWEFQASKAGESLPPPNNGGNSSSSGYGGYDDGGRKHATTNELSHAVQIALAVAGSVVGLALLVGAVVWAWIMRGELSNLGMFESFSGTSSSRHDLIMVMPGGHEATLLPGSDGKKVEQWEVPESDVPWSPRSFSYEELRDATDNFSTAAVLGEGGFGKVYKGLLKGGGASSGSVVAVKRFSHEHSRQGEKEFLAEVTIIRRLRHQNLVPLRGWCHNKRKRELLLVYDYMPNGSLDQHVLEPPDVTESGHRLPESTTLNRHALSWAGRCHAIKGVASALLYLHEDWQDAGLQQCVVHRDVKSSNVLLDADWNARLGDFGLARLVQRNKSAQTASTIVGTRGYLAPEFQYTGRISVQADVYSFGVLVLEVAAGRRPVEWFRPPSDRFLVKWVRCLQQTGRLDDAADPALGGKFKADEMRFILLLGLACTVNEPADRPSMRRVVQYLSGDTSSLVLPTYLHSFSIPDSAASPRNHIRLLNDFSSVPWVVHGGGGGESTDNNGYVCTAPATTTAAAKVAVVRVDEARRSL